MLATACSSSTGEGQSTDDTTIPAAPSSGTTIDFWHVYTGADGEALELVLDSFEEQYPDITVNPTFVGGYGQLRQKTISALRADATPNVSIAFESDALEYARQDAVVDLREYREHPEHGLSEEEWTDVLEIERLRNTYALLDGANLSMPWTVADLVMAYNADALEELGYTQAPQTWEEFSAICAEALEQLGQKCFPVSTDASTFHAVAMTYGGHAMSDDGTTASFDTQAWTDAFTLYDDLAESGVAYPTTVGTGDTSTNDIKDFAAGRATFVLRTSRLMPFIDEAVGEAFEWRAAPLPTGNGTEPTTVLFGPNIAVFKGDANEQLASWLLVKHLMSTEAQMTWAGETGQLPIRTSTTELPEYQALLEEEQWLQVAVDSLSTAQAEGAIGPDGLILPNLNDTRQMIEQAFEAVVAGTMSPAEAQEQLQAEAKPAIENARADVDDIAAEYSN